jgi:hypothetical protein
LLLLEKFQTMVIHASVEIALTWKARFQAAKSVSLGAGGINATF